MREPEGEGLAARVPASLAASRPRPAAACPAAAEEEEERRRRKKAGLGWAGLPRAALAAERGARCGCPSAARTERCGRSGAQGQRAGRGSALRCRAARPPPASLLRRRLRSARSPASDVMRGPRRCGAEGRPSAHPEAAPGRERAASPCLDQAPNRAVSRCPSTSVFPTLPLPLNPEKWH